MIELAPAKVNLCLYLGPRRPDGRHELVSVMQSLTLADRVTLTDHGRDEVRCPGVDGPNICSAALAAFRAATGWDGPGQLVRIEKRVPVAAGMGGGSADAAATLRLLFRRAGILDGVLEHAIAAGLGSDVPGQVRPGRVLARGAGELIERLPDPEPFGVLVLPSRAALSTAAVYAEADRLGLGRSADELAALDPVGGPVAYVNDLAPAALSLEPSIGPELDLALGLGADAALVSGSGPTVVGLFGSVAAAAAAARQLAGRKPPAAVAGPLRHNSSGG